jgi:rRNA maturation protein Rpf1
MNLAELAGRIRASGANAALVVTTYKGNPGEIHVYDSDGNRTHNIRIDGVVLRRDVAPSYKARIETIHELRIKEDSSHQTCSLADLVAAWIDRDITEADSALPVGSSAKGEVIFWFEDLPGGQTLWTLHDAASGIEVGPRIRIDKIKT